MMLRRGFLKLLGAAIAFIKRLFTDNLWMGGNHGEFDDPTCWSHGRVPGEHSTFRVGTGRVEIPADRTFGTIRVIGGGTLVGGTHSTKLERLIITRAASDAGCTIGKQGRTL